MSPIRWRRPAVCAVNTLMGAKRSRAHRMATLAQPVSGTPPRNLLADHEELSEPDDHGRRMHRSPVGTVTLYRYRRRFGRLGESLDKSLSDSRNPRQSSLFDRHRRGSDVDGRLSWAGPGQNGGRWVATRAARRGTDPCSGCGRPPECAGGVRCWVCAMSRTRDFLLRKNGLGGGWSVIPVCPRRSFCTSRGHLRLRIRLIQEKFRRSQRGQGSGFFKKNRTLSPHIGGTSRRTVCLT